MRELFANRLNQTLLILVLATTATFLMRTEDLAGRAAGVSTLAIAYIKGRLIILDFMDLRDAPLLWQGLFEGWLLLVSVVILLLYWLGGGALI